VTVLLLATNPQWLRFGSWSRCNIGSLHGCWSPHFL